MSQKSIEHYREYERQAIEDLHMQIKVKMERLVKMVKAAIAEEGFNPDIKELALKLAEMDTTLTTRETAFKRLVAAIEAKGA